MKKIKLKPFIVLGVLLLIIIFKENIVYAANTTIPIPNVDISFDNPSSPVEYVDNIKLLLILTVLTVLPSILIMTTGFVRIVTVLSFLKNAIGAQQSIPRQVTVGLALFLTFFVMAPTFNNITKEAVTPYLNGEITTEVAMDKGTKPLKDFMLRQTRVKDLKLFLEAGNLQDTVTMETGESGIESANYDAVPIHAILPAFVISELRTAFEIGFLLFIPFLVIDIVASSVLMSMGMFMLPPAMISLPFKLLLFVLVDGWNLISQSLILSFK
jgi:flagellar biosynthesis protein FliP